MKSRGIIENVLLAVVMTLAAVGTMVALYFTERWMFPVVKDWEVSSIRFDGSNVIVEGELTKLRECVLLQTDVRLVKPSGIAILIHQITPASNSGLGVNVATGHSTWGPMRIPVDPRIVGVMKPEDRIEVVSLHRCHLLWTQQSVYGSVQATRVLEVLR